MDRRTQELLRSLPSVAAVLSHEEVQDWLHGSESGREAGGACLPRSSVVAAVQATIERLREEILSGDLQDPVEIETILALAEQELADRWTPSLRAVINATGIVLHTGLGRAPLSDGAIEAVVECASGYCNLEYDLNAGARGRRVDHVNDLLCELTGSEAATVVNNNAAATFLILRTFASDQRSHAGPAEVIVSRGQLIEIGGSFRLPEIMAASGAVLREVGTTNRTRIADYERAINDRTAMLVRVHTSNYRIVGFAEEASMPEIAALAHRYNLVAVDDLGSGSLFPPEGHGLPRPRAGLAGEPSIPASLLSGADLVCCSGDKLLGGPQCGLILGRRALIERIEADPLMRTYRVDKMTLAALEATLREYLDVDAGQVPTDEAAFQGGPERIPAWAMLQADTDQLAERAASLLELLKKALPAEVFLVGSDVGFAGGGSMPGHELETVVIRWRPSACSAQACVEALRHAETPVIARIQDDTVCFDLRTIREREFEDLVDAVYTASYGSESNEDDENGEGIGLPILSDAHLRPRPPGEEAG